MVDILTAHQETRDNLGVTDEVATPILIGVFNEYLFLEEGPTQLTISDIGDAFILGHAVNGILGTSMLGATGYGSPSVIRVVNPNNTFHEHFRFSDFNDSTNTTGDFSTTYFNVSMDSGEIFQTLDIFKNVESIQYATCYVDLTGVKSIDAIDGVGGKIISLTEGQ